MSATTIIDNSDRVRRNVSKKSSNKVDQNIKLSIESFRFKNQQEIQNHILKLEEEWSIERRIETFASTLIVSGSLLTLFVNKKWAILPLVVGAFLLQHGIQGWCPPLPLLRALGARTRKEIDWEKFSLKALRGDFDNVSNQQQAEELLETVKKF